MIYYWEYAAGDRCAVNRLAIIATVAVRGHCKKLSTCAKVDAATEQMKADASTRLLPVKNHVTVMINPVRLSLKRVAIDCC